MRKESQKIEELPIGPPPGSRRLRLLFLLPFPPRKDGRHGGTRVIGELLERLAARHEVAVLALRGPGDAPTAEKLRSIAAHIEEVEHDERPPSKLRLLAGSPSWVASLRFPAFARRVADLAASYRPDVVQIEYPVMAQYVSALTHCPAPRVLVESFERGET